MKIKDKILEKWDLLVVIILGLLPLHLFRSGLLLSMGEGTKPLDYQGYYRFFDWYAWIPQLNFGRYNFWTPHLFPLDAFFAFFQKINVSFLLTQRLWAVFLWLGAALAMRYLIKTIAEGKDYKLWSVFSVALYLLNTFTIQFLFNDNTRLVYLATPLILALFIKGLKAANHNKYVVLIGLGTLLFATASVNPPAVAPLWIIVFLYYFFSILVNKKFIWKDLFFLIKILIFYVLINAWWIINFIPTISSLSGEVGTLLAFSAPSTALKEIFRFLGSWGFRASHQGVDYFSYNGLYYNNWLVTISSYLIPAIALAALFIRKKRNQKIIFFGLLAVVSIFLTKGMAPPLGDLYKFFWEKIPLMVIFREPYTKFTPAVTFAFSVMFGYVVSWFFSNLAVYKKSKYYRQIKVAAIILPTLLIIIASWPFFTGDVVRKESIKSMKMDYVEIPEYWQQAGKWFENNDRWSKVLLLPKSSYGDPYNWKNGLSSAGTAAKFLLPNPLITYRDGTSDAEREIIKIYGKINPSEGKNLVYYLKFLNVKYLLQLNDLDWINTGNLSPEEIAAALHGQLGLAFDRSFGEIDSYHIQDKYYLPLIYSPDKTYYFTAAGKDHSFYDFATSLPLVEKNAFFMEGWNSGKDLTSKVDNLISPLSSSQAAAEDSSNDSAVQEFSVSANKQPHQSGQAPIVEYEVINPTKYKIKITNITASFWLFFQESFSPDWYLYLDDNKNDSFLEALSLKRVKAEQFDGNIHVNAWWLPLDDLVKDNNLEKLADGSYEMDLVLEFRWQKYFYLGLAISGLILLFSLIYLVVVLVKK